VVGVLVKQRRRRRVQVAQEDREALSQAVLASLPSEVAVIVLVLAVHHEVQDLSSTHALARRPGTTRGHGVAPGLRRLARSGEWPAIGQPGLLSVPLAYAVARGDPEVLDFVNAWIDLEQKDRTTERLHEYWILGRGAAEKQPRWSVIRDVLHWVN
jgi:hypothetical protein